MAPRNFLVEGSLLNKNTMDDFKTCDKKEIIKEVSNQVRMQIITLHPNTASHCVPKAVIMKISSNWIRDLCRISFCTYMVGEFFSRCLGIPLKVIENFTKD